MRRLAATTLAALSAFSLALASVVLLPAAVAADEPEAEAEVETSSAPAVLPAGQCGGEIDDAARRLIPNGRSQDVAWSPDCSRVVFSRGGSLYTARNDGRSVRRLTRYDGSYSSEPTWSPDGEKVAYSRGRQNDDDHWFSHIYVVNADGTGRTKVSSGDAQDRAPSWSPDGERIAFERLTGDGRKSNGHFVDADRYLMIMDAADGKNRKKLAQGDSWDQSPAWSPDGSRLAYVSGDSVWLVEPNGKNAKRVAGGAFWNGGISWSPDGTQIAFARGDETESAVVVRNLESGRESIIDAPSKRNVSPSWSPDGQLIGFTNYTSAKSKYPKVYVSGAEGELIEATGCRPRGIRNNTTGFPLPSWVAPSTGELRVAVIFMDFSDARAGYSTHAEAERGLPWMEAYLEAVSYGKLDVRVTVHHGWLRAEEPSTAFLGPTSSGKTGLDSEAGEHAVELAEAEIDFSDQHAVMTVFPSSHFSGGLASQVTLEGGESIPLSLVNSQLRADSASNAIPQWGSTAAHELVHGLGLLDMYPYDDTRHERPDPPSGMRWIRSEFGLFGLRAWFAVPEDDSRLRADRYIRNSTYRWTFSYLEPEEALAWSRWQLGWLAESRIRCIGEGGTEASPAVGDSLKLELAPIARPGDGTAMTAVVLNYREVIVVESRRRLGYDAGRQVRYTDGLDVTTPGLIAEGVLVYTVDALGTSGDLPVRIAGDSGNGQFADFPILQTGDSVTVRGYTIAVTADSGSTHSVTITRNP